MNTRNLSLYFCGFFCLASPHGWMSTRSLWRISNILAFPCKFSCLWVLVPCLKKELHKLTWIITAGWLFMLSFYMYSMAVCAIISLLLCYFLLMHIRSWRQENLWSCRLSWEDGEKEIFFSLASFPPPSIWQCSKNIRGLGNVFFPKASDV